jgi:hypothetical protein
MKVKRRRQMKAIIKYEFLPEYNHCYFAKTWVDGKYFSECSDSSFEEAKDKLIKQLVRVAAIPPIVPPPPEEVEIEEAVHANQ